jgi:hypothetical protein
MPGGKHQAITDPVTRAGRRAVRTRRVQLADPVPVNPHAASIAAPTAGRPQTA